MSKNSHITGFGPECPRCGSRTVKYEHKYVSEKMLKQPFYYKYWFWCQNPRCKTQQIMPEEARVKPPVKNDLDIVSDPDFFPSKDTLPPWDDPNIDEINFSKVNVKRLAQIKQRKRYEER